MSYSGSNAPRSQGPEPSTSFTPVSACIENNERALEEKRSPGRGDPQRTKRKPRPNSEPLLVLRSRQPSNGLTDSPHLFNNGVLYPHIHQPYMQSGSSCKGNTNSEQQDTIDELKPTEVVNATPDHLADNERFPYRRSHTFDFRKSAVNPVLFLQRWVQTRLPNDPSSAQLPKRIRAATEKTYLGQTFLPHGKLEDLVTAEVVHRAGIKQAKQAVGLLLDLLAYLESSA